MSLKEDLTAAEEKLRKDMPLSRDESLAVLYELSDLREALKKSRAINGVVLFFSICLGVVAVGEYVSWYLVVGALVLLYIIYLAVESKSIWIFLFAVFMHSLLVAGVILLFWLLNTTIMQDLFRYLSYVILVIVAIALVIGFVRRFIHRKW